MPLEIHLLEWRIGYHTDPHPLRAEEGDMLRWPAFFIGVLGLGLEAKVRLHQPKALKNVSNSKAFSMEGKIISRFFRSERAGVEYS